MKDDYTTNSHYVTYTFLLRKLKEWIVRFKLQLHRSPSRCPPPPWTPQQYASPGDPPSVRTEWSRGTSSSTDGATTTRDFRGSTQPALSDERWLVDSSRTLFTCSASAALLVSGINYGGTSRRAKAEPPRQVRLSGNEGTTLRFTNDFKRLITRPPTPTSLVHSAHSKAGNWARFFKARLA